MPRFALLGTGRRPFRRRGSASRSSGGCPRARGSSGTRPALAELAHDAGYRDGWEALAALAGEAPSAHGYLVEEAVEGRECTLEGYVHGGRVTVIGVTDSIFYPGTGSFERFEYPSSLPPARLAELGALAGRLLPAHGFDGGFFNSSSACPRTARRR